MSSSLAVSTRAGVIAGAVVTEDGVDVAIVAGHQGPISANLDEVRLAADFAALFRPSVAGVLVSDFGSVVLAAEFVARGINVAPLLRTQFTGHPCATELAEFLKRLGINGRQVDTNGRVLVTAILDQPHGARTRSLWRGALLTAVAGALGGIAAWPSTVTADHVVRPYPPGAPLPLTTARRAAA